MMSRILLTFIILSSLTNAYDWKNRGGIISNINERPNQSWLLLGKTKRDAIKELLKIVESDPIGIRLISKARMKARREGKSLLDVIDVGEVSLTDTTLVRRFSPDNPFDVTYEAKSVVYVDQGHDIKDAALDLVHEVTHYTYKKPFNPYIKGFEISDFLVDTIEGRGGEIEAFIVECKVGKSLFGKSRLSPQCLSILGSDGEFSKVLASAEFYKLGPHFDKFIEMARKNNLRLERFSFLSRNSGVIISSAWGSPYPVAILEEYGGIMERVCDNDRRRLSYYASEKKRAPASKTESYHRALKDLQARCGRFK